MARARNLGEKFKKWQEYIVSDCYDEKYEESLIPKRGFFHVALFPRDAKMSECVAVTTAALRFEGVDANVEGKAMSRHPTGDVLECFISIQDYDQKLITTDQLDSCELKLPLKHAIYISAFPFQEVIYLNNTPGIAPKEIDQMRSIYSGSKMPDSASAWIAISLWGHMSTTMRKQ